MVTSIMFKSENAVWWKVDTIFTSYSRNSNVIGDTDVEKLACQANMQLAAASKF